jgi:hypothetical protein
VFAAVALIAAAGVLARSLTPPDPLLQSQADGCERNDTTLHTLESPNWVRVNDKDFPASGPAAPLQYVAGVVQKPAGNVHVSGGDNPLSHAGYDLNFDVTVPPAETDLVARTNTSGGMHVEREAQATPSFVWPEPGDRVNMYGYWVWDCDHFTTGTEVTGEETELHPFTILWVSRAVSRASRTGESEGDLFLTTDKTEAGKHSDCAHRTKHDRVAFKACVFAEPNDIDMGGVYKFALMVPPGKGPPKVRVVDLGSVGGAKLQITDRGQRDRIVFAVTVPHGKHVVVAKRIFASRTKRPVDHLRVTFDKILIRRSMDPGCIPNAPPGCGSAETTRDDQVTRGPAGEWNFYSDVGGDWSLWKPLVWTVRDGQTIRPRISFDVYAPRARPFRVFVWPRECDWASLSRGGGGPMFPCPRQSEVGNRGGDDVPGAALASFTSPGAALGTHAVNSSNAGSTCPATPNPHGCYRVTFTVRRIR